MSSVVFLINKLRRMLWVLVVLATLHVPLRGAQETTSVSPPRTRRPRTSTPRPPFNNYSRVYKHIYNEDLNSAYSIPVSWTEDTVRINVTFTLLAITPIESNPYMLGLHMRIEEEWYNLNLVWAESAYGNVSEVITNLNIWLPSMSYQYERPKTPSPNVRLGRNSYWSSVNSNGICRTSFKANLVAMCEDVDNDDTIECTTFARYVGFPDAKVKFDKVQFFVHPGLSQAKHKIISRNATRGFIPMLDSTMSYSDDMNLVLILKENDVLAFSEATWPMFCIVVCMIALCWREGASYELFSLRTGFTIFCAIACMLSVDQQLHPRIAHRPYLSWIVGFHVAMSLMVLAEKFYPALQNRFGLPDVKSLPFPGYVGRLLTAVVVLIAVIII